MQRWCVRSFGCVRSVSSRNRLIGVPELLWQTFHRAIAEAALGKQVPNVLRHTGASADAWAHSRWQRFKPEEDHCDARRKVVVSPTK